VKAFAVKQNMPTQLTRPYRPLTQLGEFSVEQFLREYWQQKPLLIRNAFPNFSPPLSADELAGLSLEDDVVSRLVIAGKKDVWQLEHGPLAEERFSTLPNTNWTLLIQHADSLNRDINDLLNAFRFLPRWRLEDIMVSYAADGGGVGPHFDYYDVFLLQAEGRRRWRIGQTCDVNSPLMAGLDLKILQQFETTEDWIVEPGDLLYIPANLAHWGEAIGECMTYSIGFRAPSYADTVLDFAEDCAAIVSEDLRYKDNNITQQAYSGEITSNAIDEIKKMLEYFSGDETLVANWFGNYITRQLHNSEEQQSGNYDLDAFNKNTRCRLSPFARCAFIDRGEHCIIFINGNSWQGSKSLAQKLSEHHPIDVQSLHDEDKALISELMVDRLLECV